MHKKGTLLISLVIASLIPILIAGQNSNCETSTSINTYPTFTLGCNESIVDESLLICDSINEFFSIGEINHNTYQLIEEDEHPVDFNFNICDGGVFDNPIFIPFQADSNAHSIDIIPILCDSFQLGPNTLSGIQVAIWETCNGQQCLASNIACDLDMSTMTINLESNEFKPGNNYFVVVDGCGGSVCQFQIVFEEGQAQIENHNIAFDCDIQNTNSYWYKYDITNKKNLSSLVLNLTNYNLFDSTVVKSYHGSCDSVTYISSNCYLNPSKNFSTFIDLINLESDTLYFEIVTQSKNCHLFQLEVIENEANCSQAEITILRPENPDANTDGPFCPGELINICYNLDFIIDQPGQGNNCQWLQGIVPVINGDINAEFTKQSIQSFEISQGWKWLDEGNVDFNNEYSAYKYITTPLGLGIQYGQYEITTGDLIPNGWWYTSSGSNCLNDGDPDNMWGLPSACDTNTKVNFCFEIKLDEELISSCQNNQNGEFEIEIFAFADGTTGCLADNYCSFDKPAQFKGIITCENTPTITLPNESITSGDTLCFDYSDISNQVNIILEADINPKINGTNNINLFTDKDTTIKWIIENTSDTVQQFEITSSVLGLGGCVNILDKKTINVNPDPTINIFIDFLQNPTCDNNDGLISITTSSNNTIEWSTGSNSNQVENLSEGIYSVTVSNQSLRDSIEIELTRSDVLELTVIDFSDLICPNNNEGFITLETSDPLENFSLLWNNGSTDLTVSGLNPGLYTATLTDGNNCKDSIEVSIESLSVTIFELESEASDCNENNTTIRIIDFDSSLIAQVIWSNGSTLDSLTNIPEGLYFATVIDTNGCRQVIEHMVETIDNTPPSILLEDLTYILPANGFVPEFTSFQYINNLEDNCNGTITVTPSTIQLDCQDAGENNIEIVAQDESGNITIDTLTIIIVDDSPPFLFCPPSLEVFGCAPVTYDVPFDLDNCGVETIELISGLGSGSTFPEGLTQDRYLATDYGGNIDSCLVEIRVDYGIEYQLISLDVSCPELDDGSIIFNGSAINEPLTLNILNHTGSLFNVAAGEYYAEISDTLGCTLTDTITVNAPESITFTNIDIIPFDDFIEDNGFINVTVQGGTPPYSYLWRKNGIIFSQDEDLINLEKGIYTLYIEDLFGCEFVSQDFAIGILTSLEDIIQDQTLTVYPNPSDHIIFIDSEKPILYLELFDTNGQLIVKESKHTMNFLNINNCAQGVYLLVIGFESGKVIRKVIIE